MLEYDRIDVPEGIGVNKTNGFLECTICHYLYLLKVTFSFQSKVCNDWHNLMQKVMSLLDVAIASVKGNFYRIHFWYMSKEKSINKIKNSDLRENSGSL